MICKMKSRTAAEVRGFLSLQKYFDMPLRCLLELKNKKSFNKILLLSFLPIMVFLSVSCSSVVRDKLNGGFENSFDDDNPDGWTSNQLPQTAKYARLAVDNSVAHSGDKSISISILKTLPSTNTVYNWVRRIDGLKPAVYELSGWIKTEGIKSSPFIEVECWNAENKMFGSATTETLHPVTGTQNWKQVKTLFKIPPGTIKALIIAGIGSSQNSGGKVWFDDVVIRQVK